MINWVLVSSLLSLRKGYRKRILGLCEGWYTNIIFLLSCSCTKLLVVNPENVPNKVSICWNTSRCIKHELSTLIDL